MKIQSQDVFTWIIIFTRHKQHEVYRAVLAKQQAVLRTAGLHAEIKKEKPLSKEEIIFEFVSEMAKQVREKKITTFSPGNLAMTSGYEVDCHSYNTSP